MNKICTTIEQSQRLIELGIDRTTADMYYSFDYNIDEYEDDAQIIPKSELGQHFSLFPEDIPAWSLSTLLELIPERIPGTKLVIKWDGSYYIEGRDCLFDNALDAVFEMVCWLKENKKI